MNAIVSLRGNLPALVWPAELDERVRASRLVRQDWHEQRGLPGVREISMQHQGIQRSAARIFFEAQGWSLRASRSHPTSLFGHTLYSMGARPAGINGPTLIRHAHFAFFDHTQNIGAAVVHQYGAHELAALPANIAVDLLPASWYYQEMAHAFCLRLDPLTADDGTLRDKLTAIDATARALNTGTTQPANAGKA